MKKSFCFIGLFFLALRLSAQMTDPAIEQGKEVLTQIMNAKGEKVYQLLNQEMKSAVTAPQLNSLWMGLIMQFGKFEKVGHWKKQMMGSSQIITARLHFEKQSLLFLVSFYEGKINGLRVMPDPEAEKPQEQPESNEKFVEKEVTVITGQFRLPGFLTVPQKGTDFPCVILVHGSGAQDRNETLGENRPFKDLAHGLAERGIATLRYDKRTYVYGAGSVPEGEELNLKNEVTDDVLSAVRLVRSEKGLDPRQVFVLGHSLGGMLAPRIATLCPDIKGIILLAGNARPFEELLFEQIAYLNSLHPSPGWEEHVAKLKKQFANVKKYGTPEYDSSIDSPLSQPISYWRDLDNYRQTETIKELTLPILILNGERDYNVTMKDFNLWKKALTGKKNATFKTYPTLNHLFMESSEKPTPEDYNTPRHIPDNVINDIANWIKEQN